MKVNIDLKEKNRSIFEFFHYQPTVHRLEKKANLTSRISLTIVLNKDWKTREKK